MPEKPRAAYVSDMWRASSKGMVRTDAKAERIKRRKAAKQALQSLVRGEPNAIVGVTLVLRTLREPEPSEECPDCLALQRRVS